MTNSNTPLHNLSQTKDYFEFRAKSGIGVRVIRVYYDTPTLKLLAFYELPNQEWLTPLSLYENEIQFYFDQVKARLKRKEQV